MLREVSKIICRISQEVPNHKVAINQEVYTRAELNHLDSLEIIELPIFITDKPRAGIFKDYAHFKSNTPDIETEMIIEDSRKKTNVARLYGEKRKKVWIETKGIYAVSDGNRMFKATPYGFFEIKKGARELYYERNASYTELAGPANTYFGAAGSLVPLRRDMPRRYKLKINHRRGNIIPIAVQQ
ncbi:hypothetical protein [Dyadobacter sp. Leaf189]|uniref:hypothetical protein n=1 Tax=Dyadobacter sp. Leaf189 TaxID=1736295 RepID=UPI0006F8B312|nr:hypothetical protein [Dyadobacter sp. Leaf189]KQS26860.1 hypothetical protein ASG33_20160 [Dyadobacter sp. Leaf189]